MRRDGMRPAAFSPGRAGQPRPVARCRAPLFLRTAQVATVVNLGFIFAALLCAFALPATLGAERAWENR